MCGGLGQKSAYVLTGGIRFLSALLHDHVQLCHLVLGHSEGHAYSVLNQKHLPPMTTPDTTLHSMTPPDTTCFHNTTTYDTRMTSHDSSSSKYDVTSLQSRFHRCRHGYNDVMKELGDVTA